MDKEKIINYLEENGFSDVELMSEQKGLIATRFYYDFDKDELKAAEAYANDASGKEKNDSWHEDFYIPYLTELAIDNVGEIMEEITNTWVITITKYNLILEMLFVVFKLFFYVRKYCIELIIFGFFCFV